LPGDSESPPKERAPSPGDVCASAPFASGLWCITQKSPIENNKHGYYFAPALESFGFDIAETARAMRRDFDRRAASLGATRAQWRVLARLARTDGARQVDLAEALDVEPISLCRMVDRLQDAGLVERRRDEYDRRAWNIFLTDKARPLIERLRLLGDQFHEDALRGLSSAEIMAARDVFARIRANLSKSGDAAGREAI
jgi:DNA-binding MarR family transcriptional regulator